MFKALDTEYYRKTVFSEATGEYNLKSNVVYYVLKDEYIENNETDKPNNTSLVREYECYNGNDNTITSSIEYISSVKVSDIKEFREKNLVGLRLEPKTIVSSKVLERWKSQNYDGTGTYWAESPEGLSYDDIN